MRCVLSARFPGEEEGGQIDRKESISQFFLKKTKQYTKDETNQEKD